MRRAPRALRPRPGPRVAPLCPWVASPPPGCAHKDPDLRNTRRTQGRNQALVCDAVLPDSGPCVRHREGRAVTGHAPRPAGPEGGGRTDARYWHRRALFAPARVISPSRCQRLPRDADNPLTVSTTPSRCRQPPRGVNDSLTMSTTPSRCQRPPHGVDNARRRPACVRAPALPGARRRRPRGASAAPRPPRWRALVEPVGDVDRALPRARPSRVRRRRPRGPPRRARRRCGPAPGSAS